MSEKKYDVVIVGAGVAGAIIARQLAESGKSVLIIEAGPGTGLEKDGYRTFVQRYYKEYIKIPNSPYPHSVSAPAPSVLDVYNQPGNGDSYLVQKGPQPYMGNYTRSAGGTTLHWMGTCLRMLPNDFKMNRQYGCGVDWPIDYEELQPYYEKAEWEIGVSANAADQEVLDQEKLFRSGYDYPMSNVPQSFLDKQLAKSINGMTVKLEGKEYTLGVLGTPAGRNSSPRTGTDPRYPHFGKQLYRPVGAPDNPDEVGQRCQGNSSCVPICPVQAKYSALKTLRNAIEKNHGRVHVISQAVASEIKIDPDSGRVNGIFYRKYKDPHSTETTEHCARGAIYVIAAHAIETAKLLLASGAANSSDQVGRNLMDHPYLLAWGRMPQNIGSYRGPSSTSGIPQLRDGAFRSIFSAFRVEIGNWGWDWPKGTPYSTVNELVEKGGHFGDDLRNRIAEIETRRFRFGFGVEQLPSPCNRVTIDAKYKDASGNYRPMIQYHLSDYCRKGLAEARRVSEILFSGIKGADDQTKYESIHPSYFEFEGKALQYYSPGHAAGTHRMGASRQDSVVNVHQQSWDHENLYLVSCGNFCTIGTANPTLTLAALAFKAAEKIIKVLRV